MKCIRGRQTSKQEFPSERCSERGFTLVETAISLVIMMVVGLGAASLFAYATRSNSSANDRELAMAIAQTRMEWFRNIPFDITTRGQAYSYPNGGLGATTGTVESTSDAGRPYSVTTIIEDLSVVPAGQPDAGAPTVKRITVTVTPLVSGLSLGAVTLSTQRSTLVPGTF
jgi:type II secretory pathway pseudopilin PulG